MWVLRIANYRGHVVHLCSSCAAKEPPQLVEPKPEGGLRTYLGKPCAQCQQPIDQ